MRAKDLRGQQFGKLSVISRGENNKWGEACWKCLCACGTEKIVRGKDLTRGKQTSCGCNRGRKNAIDIAGQRFGMLIAIKPVDKANGSILWLCKCDCGNEVYARAFQLRRGDIVSCGKHSWRTTHGMKGTRLYRIWLGMRARCNYPTASGYKNYGGRGIMVCKGWDESFEAFMEWALANGYTDDLSIDRKENDGNYEPSNCRWATDQEQRMNKRTSKKKEVVNT